MSLLEVVVAMAVFAIGVTAVLGVFMQTGAVAGDNLRRTTAANLVSQQLEKARSQTPQQIPDDPSTTVQTVGSVTYTITQNASYLTSGATSSACTGTSGALAYKLVRVSVSWDNMGLVKPVTGDLLRSVGFGPNDGTKGALSVLVKGSTGLGVPGVTVTLVGTGKTQVTGADGCVLFATLDSKAYSVSVNQAGYVGIAGTQSATSNPYSVAAGQLTKGELLYDTSRTVNLTAGVPDGVSAYVVPSGVPIQVGNTLMTTTKLGSCTGSSLCLSGFPGQIRNLFPEVQTVTAGQCTTTDASQAAIDNRLPATDDAALAIPLGAVTVNVRSVLTGQAASARTVTLTSGDCSGNSYRMTSGSTILLPYGTYNVSVPSGVLASKATVGSAARTATLTVNVVT
ncbi:hypothetical protein JCM9957A_70950 [Kineosporia succinea]|uniref:Type II secretory pathway pseudopilin PulG n=2 Tax=Kineosporia succinea TaxID=84632 RepID=A0ABT9NV61_9ACTN|nr:type II secretion system protein [Kineosporia succinea]MDP9824314.1 type II secretory pathway pseudopilin PulG [Kineosporia succinea]